MCRFYPKEPAYLGLQNYLAFACCMSRAALVFCVPTHADLPEYIPSPSMNEASGMPGKTLRRMTSWAFGIVAYHALCTYWSGTAVYRKCHASKRPPDVIVGRKRSV